MQWIATKLVSVFNYMMMNNLLLMSKFSLISLTYVRIISYYCQQGDMDNAKLLLETMTKNNMPINKEIYNALITGYCRTG